MFTTFQHNLNIGSQALCDSYKDIATFIIKLPKYLFHSQNVVKSNIHGNCEIQVENIAIPIASSHISVTSGSHNCIHLTQLNIFL